MAEDTYPEYLEDESLVSATPRRIFIRSKSADLKSADLRLGAVRRIRLYPSKPARDYAVYKATLAGAVEEIKCEMRVQHEQTRVEIRDVKRDVLQAIKESPAESLKLICEFGFLFLLFSLAVRFILKIELVNTGFALFMLPSLAVYWAMARLKQYKDGGQREETQA